MDACFSFQATVSFLFVLVVGTVVRAEPIDARGDPERVIPARIQLDDPVRLLGSLCRQALEFSDADPRVMAGECDPASGESECPTPESALRMEPVAETFEKPLVYRWDAQVEGDQEPVNAVNTVQRLMTYGSDSRTQVYVPCPDAYTLCWRDGSLPFVGQFAAPVSANPYFVVLFSPGDQLLEEDPDALSSGDDPRHSDQLSRHRRPLRKSYTLLEGARRPSWKIYAQGY